MTEYQAEFDEVSEDYKQFVEKFKPKKTTDDCYTPEPVFAVVQDYVCRRYGVDQSSIVRPFWPGADYQKTDYPPGCTVVDNPPFSILAKIVRWYDLHGVRFFLFAPALTTFTGGAAAAAICTGASITYANGAVVNTSFLTNLEPPDVAARSDPELHRLLERASDEVQKANKKEIAKLAFPLELVTAARMNYYSIHGTEFVFLRSDSVFVRKLDNYPSDIFGGGFLLSPRAAAERVALSDRERRLVAMLDGDKPSPPDGSSEPDNPSGDLIQPDLF